MNNDGITMYCTNFILATSTDVTLDWGTLVAIAIGVILLIFAARWAIRKAREEQAPEPAKEPRPKQADKPKQPESKQDQKIVETAQSFEEGLKKTRSDGFVSRLSGLFKGKQLDAGLLEEVETVLYTADIGVRTTEKLLLGLRDGLNRKELTDGAKVWGYMEREARGMLTAAQRPEQEIVSRPRIIMVVGVNGTGKTTSIGKLADRYRRRGEKVLLGAGDTFRAAAVDQLDAWAKRASVDIYKGTDKQDPASVLYDAAKKAVMDGYDVLLADTAGRLQTSANLVEELRKIHRVIGQAVPGAPHEVWLVLDATMGQNAIQQARIFLEAVNVTGLVLTKLDGTAKGGVVIGICDEMKIPIRFVGTGERIEDMRPFDTDAFIRALFGT